MDIKISRKGYKACPHMQRCHKVEKSGDATLFGAMQDSPRCTQGRNRDKHFGPNV